jgi:hypothetical protein
MLAGVALARVPELGRTWTTMEMAKSSTKMPTLKVVNLASRTRRIH